MNLDTSLQCGEIISEFSYAFFKTSKADHFMNKNLLIVGASTYGVVAFEDSNTRLAWSDKLIEPGFAITSLISPKAYVSTSAQINQGCIIEPLAGVNSNVSVGACSIIKMGALINHNSVVAEGCCCENYSIIKTCAYVEPHRVIEMRRTIESYEEEQRIRNEYN